MLCDILCCTIHLIYLLQFITITTCDILNTINVNGSSSHPDITILEGRGTRVDSYGNWHINVIEQSGSDLAILMNEKWKFDSLKPSTINIIIDGITPTSTETNNGDTDFIILFSTLFDTNRQQFFSATFHLDEETSYAYKIYPNTNETLAIGNIFDIISDPTIDRWHKYSQNNQWVNALPEYKLAAKWPLYFSITNFPKLNKVLYEWRDGINSNNVISVEYISSFTTQKGLDIYIAGDSPNEQLIITNINITLSVSNDNQMNDNLKDTKTNVNANIHTPNPILVPTETLNTNIPTGNVNKYESLDTLNGGVKNINFSIETTNGNENIWYNETKITFDSVSVQQIDSINKWYIIYAVIGLVVIIFVIIMYMICIVVRGNYKCDSKSNNNYMKSHSNSAENIPKCMRKNYNNKSRESYDICKESTNILHIMKCTDSVDETSESELIIENENENEDIECIQQIDVISENENENESENDNEMLLVRNTSEYMAHTIISGVATIGSLSNEEMYDLDSMLLSQPSNKKGEWSCSAKLKGDTSYEQYQTGSSIEKYNNNNFDETDTLCSNVCSLD